MVQILIRPNDKFSISEDSANGYRSPALPGLCFPSETATSCATKFATSPTCVALAVSYSPATMSSWYASTACTVCSPTAASVLQLLLRGAWAEAIIGALARLGRRSSLARPRRYRLCRPRSRRIAGHRPYCRRCVRRLRNSCRGLPPPTCRFSTEEALSLLSSGFLRHLRRRTFLRWRKPCG